MMILAASELSPLLPWANLGLTAALGIGLFWLGKVTQDRRDQMNALSNQIAAGERTRKEEVKELSEQLHEANTKLLDERDRRISHSMNNHVQSMNGAIEIWRKRIEVSETQIASLTNARAHAEVELIKAINQLREFVRECAPTRKEFDKVSDELSTLSTKVEQLARETINLDDMRKLLKEVRQG